MAILGTFIDRQTVSRAGDAGTTNQNIGLTTLPHSLPATNPEASFVNFRSIQALGAVGGFVPKPFILGGNASLLTQGTSFEGFSSAISAPTIMYDVVTLTFHSIIR